MEVRGIESVRVLSLQIVRELHEGAVYRVQVSPKGEEARECSNKFQRPATTETFYHFWTQGTNVG